MFDPGSTSGRERLEYTKSLLHFWNENTKVPFWEIRGQMKTVAHRTWHEVLGVDEILLEADFDSLVDDTFEPNDVVLFVDDDDWIAPDVFKQLERHVGDNDQGVVWGRVRFDGDWQWTDLTGAEFTVYTNNYVVRARSIGGQKLSFAMQHGTVEELFRQHQWWPVLAEMWGITVTNKSPCCWNYLHQSVMHSDPVAEFHSRVQRYLQPSERLDPRVRWAKDATEAAREVIRSALV